MLYASHAFPVDIATDVEKVNGDGDDVTDALDDRDSSWHSNTFFSLGVAPPPLLDDDVVRLRGDVIGRVKCGRSSNTERFRFFERLPVVVVCCDFSLPVGVAGGTSASSQCSINSSSFAASLRLGRKARGADDVVAVLATDVSSLLRLLVLDECGNVLPNSTCVDDVIHTDVVAVDD